jgi:hypothetical protein
MLRPLAEFQAEISALAREGARRVSVPDAPLYGGETLDEGLHRMKVLTRHAKALGVTLYIRNDTRDPHARREADPV